MRRNPDHRGLARTALASAVAAAAVATSAAAQVAPASQPLKFPASLDNATLVAWLTHETNLSPDSVVAISPLALIAITDTKPLASPDGYEVVLRAETLDGAFSEKEGLASWNATMKLDCKGQAFSMGEVTGHTGRNLKGEARPIQTALVGWKPVTPGTMQGEIWNARCGKDFRPPLAAPKPTTIAKVETAKPAPAAVNPTPPAKPEGASVAAPAPKPAASTEPPPEPTAAKPAPKPSPAQPPVRGGRSAQVLSAPTADEASRAIVRLKSRLGDAMAGLTSEVVPAQVGGKTTYRAIVSGFKAPADAGLFCQKVEAAGGKCLVRADSGRTP